MGDTEQRHVPTLRQAEVRSDRGKSNQPPRRRGDEGIPRMSRLHIATRGIGSWRERLANPNRHWRRLRSAFETAVSWEWAARRRRPSQLPEPIERLFLASEFTEPTLLIAVAEHQVELAGRGNDSQCDVWGLVRTEQGTISLSVEA